MYRDENIRDYTPAATSSNYSSNNEVQRKIESIAEFNNVEKEYVIDKYKFKALKGASCKIPKGEMTFLFGPSGSGKTTFLNLLGLLDQPTAGEIFLMGEKVSDFNDNRAADFRSKNIGFIFQSFNLISVLSVLENVEFPLLHDNISRSERRERAEHYLEAVGLGELINRNIGEISGGQRQRVAIARALVTNPALVIADEPTANLDIRTSQEIVDLMTDMKSKFKTSFVICTHDETLINEGSRLIHIVDGQLQDTGGLK